MITTSGILGLSLLVGALRRHVAVFNADGTGGALATVAAIATLSLVLPSFTTSRPGPSFPPAQLGFAAVASLGLYALFVTVQTRRHRDYLLPITTAGRVVETEEHASPPSGRTAGISLGMLSVVLVAVDGLAKADSPSIESAVAGGSAMASIGLTILAIAIAMIWLPGPLLLGLGGTQTVLLALTFGRTCLSCAGHCRKAFRTTTCRSWTVGSAAGSCRTTSMRSTPPSQQVRTAERDVFDGPARLDTTVPAAEFFAAVENFDGRFIAAMGEHVIELERTGPPPGIALDVPGLRAEHTQRSRRLEQRLATPRRTDWPTLRAGLARFASWPRG